MRFFSNEAQENVDNNADDKADERATRDPAGTTAVPQQRAGSPWQHDTDTSPQPTAVGTPSQPTVVGTPPQPTAVGTSPVGDANTIRPAEDADPAGPDKVGTGDKDHDKIDADKKDDDKIDAALDDRGTFDDPHVTETGSHVDEKADGKADGKTDDKADGKTADKADHEADDKLNDKADEAVHGKLDEKADEHVAAKAANESPEATTPSGAAPFFPATDTPVMKDRWRDVQLRFVDDPKGATAEAAKLVDEAVDKLSKALRDHRGSLAKGSDDTEQLRVELRSYRDILDRLLGL
jgi:hypothetical protein